MNDKSGINKKNLFYILGFALIIALMITLSIIKKRYDGNDNNLVFNPYNIKEYILINNYSNIELYNQNTKYIFNVPSDFVYEGKSYVYSNIKNDENSDNYYISINFAEFNNTNEYFKEVEGYLSNYQNEEKKISDKTVIKTDSGIKFTYIVAYLLYDNNYEILYYAIAPIDAKTFITYSITTFKLISDENLNKLFNFEVEKNKDIPKVMSISNSKLNGFISINIKNNDEYKLNISVPSVFRESYSDYQTVEVYETNSSGTLIIDYSLNYINGSSIDKLASIQSDGTKISYGENDYKNYVSSGTLNDKFLDKEVLYFLTESDYYENNAFVNKTYTGTSIYKIDEEVYAMVQIVGFGREVNRSMLEEYSNYEIKKNK